VTKSSLDKENVIDKSIKTLVFGAQFSNDYGSGIFTSHLFSGWSKENLATISTSNFEQNSDACSQHYCLGDKEIIVSRLFNHSKMPKLSNTSNANEQKIVHFNNSEKANDSILKRIGSKILSWIGGKELFSKIRISNELTFWIDEFKPDVLYGVCSNYNSVKLLRELHNSLDIPLVLHFMDDWPSTLYSNGLAKYTIKHKYKRAFYKLIQQADAVIAISESMAQEYEKRYKIPVVFLPIPIDIEPYRKTYRSNWKIEKQFKIRYGGRIGWAINLCLETFSLAVEKLAQEGYCILFEIATNQIEKVPAVCNRIETVKVTKLPPLSELPQISAESDLHLICYDFDDYSIKQAKFSMPGKLPACMASGTPILVYAPLSLPVTQYAIKSKWGYVSTSSSIDDLICDLRKLIDSEILRSKFGTVARKIALDEHNALLVSGLLKGIFYDLL